MLKKCGVLTIKFNRDRTTLRTRTRYTSIKKNLLQNLRKPTNDSLSETISSFGFDFQASIAQGECVALETSSV